MCVCVSHGRKSVFALSLKLPGQPLVQRSMANDPAGKSCVLFFFVFFSLLLSLVCLVPPRVCLHFAVAALQKQLLKLKYAVFVYYESDLPLRISITVLLLPVNLRLHTRRKTDAGGE